MKADAGPAARVGRGLEPVRPHFSFLRAAFRGGPVLYKRLLGSGQSRREPLPAPGRDDPVLCAAEFFTAGLVKIGGKQYNDGGRS